MSLWPEWARAIVRERNGRVEILQRAADVGPTAMDDRWLLTIGKQAFYARYLRPWHVRWFNRRLAQGAAEAKRHPRLAAQRLEAARIGSLRFLLHSAFPWRFNYLIRGNPVTLITRAPLPEQATALLQLLTHVRPAARPHLYDRVFNRVFSPSKGAPHA